MQIATRIGASPQVCEGLGRIFESFADPRSSGPMAGASTPITVHVANLAGDIEVFSRESGFAEAMTRVASQSDRSYPPALVEYAVGEGRARLRANWSIKSISIRPATGRAGMAQVSDWNSSPMSSI